jgi:GNAT superfamily N-acetyltransferase
MITFATEKWSDFWRDGIKLFPEHYHALSTDGKMFDMSINWERYAEFEASGILYVFTIRDNGLLTGYLIMMTLPHLHYVSSGLMAHTDMYWVTPEYRKGGNGAKLFMYAERELRKMGCVKMYTSCKVKEDHSQMFKMLGFNPTDYIFTKVLV